MKRMISACLRFEAPDLWLAVPAALFPVLVGEVTALMIAATEDDPEALVLLPGVVGMILTVVLCCVLGVVYLCSNFPLLLQFSASRRGSLAGLCLHILRMTVLAEVIAAAATMALGAVNHGFFPRFAVGELWRGIPVFVWPICAVLPVPVGLVWAGVLTRFGRTGGWVLYFLLIGGCFSVDKWLHPLAEQPWMVVFPVGVLAALLLKSTVFKGEAVPFVMELPNYRLPGLKNVAQLLWEKARDFLQRAFTVIFGATIIIWFLQNFDLRLSLTADPQTSILARIAGDIAPLFAPLGFADWRISTALISGFMAKESVVSSLLVLFGSTAALTAALTPAQAAPLLVFCLLYTPCIAAVASVKRELGGKWAAIMVVNQCAVAWLCALLVRLVAVAVF